MKLSRQLKRLKPSCPMRCITEMLNTEATDASQSPDCKLPTAEESDSYLE
jgi:hypothetical protein